MGTGRGRGGVGPRVRPAMVSDEGIHVLAIVLPSVWDRKRVRTHVSQDRILTRCARARKKTRIATWGKRSDVEDVPLGHGLVYRSELTIGYRDVAAMRVTKRRASIRPLAFFTRAPGINVSAIISDIRI